MIKNNLKTILKALLIIVALIIIFILLHIIRNYIIIKKLQSTSSEYVSSQNYNMKSIETSKDNRKIARNYYKRDDKKVLILVDESNEKTSKSSFYTTGSDMDYFYIDNTGLKDVISLSDSTLDESIFDYFGGKNNWEILLNCFSANIKSTTLNGKKCYIIKNFKSTTISYKDSNHTAYIEKDTGLLVKYDSSELTVEITYDFNNVSDEILTEPSIENYTLNF